MSVFLLSLDPWGDGYDNWVSIVPCAQQSNILSKCCTKHEPESPRSQRFVWQSSTLYSIPYWVGALQLPLLGSRWIWRSLQNGSWQSKENYKTHFAVHHWARNSKHNRIHFRVRVARFLSGTPITAHQYSSNNPEQWCRDRRDDDNDKHLHRILVKPSSTTSLSYLLGIIPMLNRTQSCICIFKNRTSVRPPKW